LPISFTVSFLIAILAALGLTLSVYGDSWLVPWHDEVVIVRLAQNLALGKGFRNDLLDDLLPGADEKTYWQMPLYPFTLSLWGKMFGFDLDSLRCLNRMAGILSLVLMFLLASRLGLSSTAILFAVLWTATDLTFQFSANFVRPEIWVSCMLLLTSLLLAVRVNLNLKDGILLGFISGLAVFFHPIALPFWLVTMAIFVKRSSWRNGFFFSLPFFLFASLWLIYALQGWEIFLVQMKAHFLHKHYSITDRLAFLVGSTAWGIRFYIGIPLNTLPWLIPIAAMVLVRLREGWLLPRWFFASTIVLYLTVMLGAEAWYPSLLVPFGYLMLAAFADHLFQKASTKFERLVIAMAALVWWSYQASVVAKHLSAVPTIRQQVAKFVAEVESSLPPQATILVGSFSPDPTLALLKHRPDLRIYLLMPSQMVSTKALRQLRTRLTHLLVHKEALVKPLLKGHEIKRWQFDYGGLSEVKKNVIVFLSVNEE